MISGLCSKSVEERLLELRQLKANERKCDIDWRDFWTTDFFQVFEMPQAWSGMWWRSSAKRVQKAGKLGCVSQKQLVEIMSTSEENCLLLITFRKICFFGRVWSWKNLERTVGFYRCRWGGNIHFLRMKPSSNWLGERGSLSFRLIYLWMQIHFW